MMDIERGNLLLDELERNINVFNDAKKRLDELNTLKSTLEESISTFLELKYGIDKKYEEIDNALNEFRNNLTFQDEKITSKFNQIDSEYQEYKNTLEVIINDKYLQLFELIKNHETKFNKLDEDIVNLNNLIKDEKHETLKREKEIKNDLEIAIKGIEDQIKEEREESLEREKILKSDLEETINEEKEESIERENAIKEELSKKIKNLTISLLVSVGVLTLLLVIVALYF